MIAPSVSVRAEFARESCVSRWTFALFHRHRFPEAERLGGPELHGRRVERALQLVSVVLRTDQESLQSARKEKGLCFWSRS